MKKTRLISVGLFLFTILFVSGCSEEDIKELEQTSEKSATPLERNTNKEPIKTTIEMKQTIITKSLEEMFPTREEVPTEFRLGNIKDITLSETPVGFESGKTLEIYKIVGDIGLGYIGVDFNVLKFISLEDAKKYHEDDINKIKNEGGYAKLNIKVPNDVECFSFSEDYGFDARFVYTNCLKGNVAYQVVVTASDTFEKPDKYLSDMVFLINNKINQKTW